MKDRITVMKLDVTNHEEINQVVTSVTDQFGAIDVLVNNAGYAEGGFVEEVTMGEMAQAIRDEFLWNVGDDEGGRAVHEGAQAREDH